MITFSISPGEKYGKGNPKSKIFSPYFSDAGIIGVREKKRTFLVLQ